jgi:hypothetical protein
MKINTKIFIEKTNLLGRTKNPTSDLAELKLINQNANRLNKEAADVLTDQITL